MDSASSALLSRNSCSSTGSRSPPETKACPPQLSPDSILNSATSTPFFCKELPLNQGRTEIAHLQNDLLFDLPLVIAVEILELRDVVVEAGVKSGRENQGGVEYTLCKAAQSRIGIAKLSAQRYALFIGSQQIHFRHNVDVDRARQHLFGKFTDKLFPGAGVGQRGGLFIILPESAPFRKQLEVTVFLRVLKQR